MPGTNTTFIEAKTYTFTELCELKNNDLIVPIFQRPYSWGEKEIERFINDIFTGFWGSDRSSCPEPLFAGTIQLFNSNEIIDGQQRLSTLLLLQKVLNLKFFSNVKSKGKKFIKTKVNSGTQENFLTNFSNIKSYKCLESEIENLRNTSDDDKSYNVYIRNAGYVDSTINTNTEEYGEEFDSSEFWEYIQNQILFVVIETKASLSKSLQIFKTINTSGMDLNTADLFKIKIYYYLKPKNEFEEISDIYKKADDNEVSMDSVLDIYQTYLIAKYNLPNALYDLSKEKFFERLFDTLDGTNNSWENFGNMPTDFELNLDDLQKIIDILVFWKEADYRSIDEMLAVNLFWWERYTRHDKIVHLLFFRFWESKKPNNIHKDITPILIVITKLFFIYSMNYDKVVYEIHSFVYALYRDIFSESITTADILEKINQKIKDFSNNNEKFDSFISEKLKGQIYYSATKRNLMGLLAAYFEERKNKKLTVQQLEEKLFNQKFDIEHIHATADNTTEVSEELQNCIGNLMLLERKINRSIGKKTFTEKKKQYRNSSYKFARKLAGMTQYKWAQKDIENRRDNIVDQTKKFLFE